MRKVGVIGCGMVGMSFVYSLLQQENEIELVLLDANQKVAEGNALDMEDAVALIARRMAVRAGTYADLKDASVIVITAGRPQKPGESRLEMIKDNSQIMKEIARQVKGSGFSGITIIASNPVDCLTYVYQKETNYPRNRVIGSGTVLDSARMDVAVARRLKLHPKDVSTYLVGEHGDSSVLLASQILIKGKPAENALSASELKRCHEESVKKAGKIIDKKRATYYGIGNSLAWITQAALSDRKLFAPVGVFVKGLHGAPDVVAGYPALVGKNGIEEVKELKLTTEEKANFVASATKLTQALKEIGY